MVNYFQALNHHKWPAGSRLCHPSGLQQPVWTLEKWQHGSVISKSHAGLCRCDGIGASAAIPAGAGPLAGGPVAQTEACNIVYGDRSTRNLRCSPDSSKLDPLSVDSRQLRTPLVDAVRERGDAVLEAPFHVPGHKRGVRTPGGLVKLVRPASGSVLQYDLTEIAGLDFLSSPSGVILEAQQLAAEAFGADHTWFLVNGCSAGIHAAVMAVTAEALAAAAGSADEVAVGTSNKSSSNSIREGGCCANMGSHLGDGGGGTSCSRATLVLARNCHLSAFSALVIAGCEPFWVQPEVDPVFGVAHCVTPESVRRALRIAATQGRRVVGVLIVSPTYFGAVADVEAIAAVCHEQGVPLLVDEAHGGHFAFMNLPPSSPASPAATSSATGQAPEALAAAAAAAGSFALPLRSSLRCGADLVMQSTHKVLGAMTQAAMLHAVGPRVSPSRVSAALQMLQSSSPSYLLMASLDAARAQAAAGGAFDEATAAAQVIRVAVSSCKYVQLLDRCTAGATSSVYCFDPLRLTLLVEALRLRGGGFEAAEWLEQQYGVVSELATAKTVVLALGPGTTMIHATIAAAAIQKLDQCTAEGDEEEEEGGRGEAATAKGAGAGAASDLAIADAQAGGGACGDLQLPASTAGAGVQVEVVLTPREAYFAASESVPAAKAIGRVSAELLCPYPPGVPVLFPGERITAPALQVLHSTLAAGGAVTGARDSTLATVQVVMWAGRSK